MRVLAPTLGPLLTTELRVVIAGLVLTAYYQFIGQSMDWKKNLKNYLAIGFINSALPFSLFAFAALYIPAAYSVVLNSTAPFFGVVFSSIWLAEKFTARKLLGIAIGACGVALVAKLGKQDMSPMFIVSILLCLAAAMCYGLGGIYVKLFAKHLNSKQITAGSQIGAALCLLPLMPLNPPVGEVSLLIALNILGLALLCSAAAYLLYYRLLSDIGPTKALTVTFLMPMFGMLWGHLFLGENISVVMVLGAGLIIFGTQFVVRVST